KPADEYQRTLKREFDHLRVKYSLTPMEPVQWKTFRLRPGSLPILRIVQLVTLVEGIGSWSVFFNERPVLNELRAIFKRPMPSYFCEHHAFGKKSKIQRKAIGDQMITTIIVNGLVPMILFSSFRLGDQSLKEYAYELLEGMEPERNSITREFTKMGDEPVNAMESQGMIHLKRTYCDHRKCLFCAIGNAILKKP
ncbi:MAG: DUF2851 family protein, partial [Bacteroidota bacterium]|nr:DUF2851 family protein [Bacteroidota bacterium]